MPANFFNFPAEIRHKIYEELLVLSEPITLITTWGRGRSWPPFSLSKRYGLCPALLRANKRVQREASPLLYSGNRFGFSHPYPMTRIFAECQVLTSFLNQIGRQNASFLRHISIHFPDFDDSRPGRATLRKESMKLLELIRDNCTSIATLETSLDSPDLSAYTANLDSSLITGEALELLDARFKAISSLKEIIVNVPVYGNECPSDSLRKKMRDCGWTIKDIELEDSEYYQEAYYELYIDTMIDQEW